MEIIEMARELGKAIQQQSVYKDMMLAKNNNDNDQQLQNLIGEFNLARLALNEEMNKTEKDQKKIEKLDAKVKDIYAQVMKNPHMFAYSQAKNAVNELMNQINMILMMAVNGQDPDKEISTGCSGNCNGCAGCH